MYYQKLKGTRLYLSPMDIAQEMTLLTQWLNEDETIAYNNSFYHRLLGMEKVEELLTKWNEGPFSFSVVQRENDVFMGHISLFDIAAHEQFATMGIYLGKQYRGKGYGQEAIALLADYAFHSQRFQALHLEVFAFNTHAIQTYRQLGFQECGRWHNCYYHMGQFHDIILMERLRNDWKKER